MGMREPANPHDLHWGESDLNAGERNGGSRNEESITSFLDWVEARSHTFFIQTCGHTASRKSRGEYVSDVCPRHVERNCRAVTAIFYPQPSDVEPDAQKVSEMRVIANAMKVPLFVITHHPYDFEYEMPVRIDRYVKGRRVEHVGVSWDSVQDALRAEQFHHESSLEAEGKTGGSLHPSCNSRGVMWLDPAKTVSAPRGVDLTVSTIVREIPGVRHIDIDAAVICPDCDRPYCIIEGTSDGLGAREAKSKAGFMARSVATKLGAKTLMIHHQIGDRDLTSSVRIEMFHENNRTPERRVTGDWDVADSALQAALDYHQRYKCRGGRRP